MFIPIRMPSIYDREMSFIEAVSPLDDVVTRVTLDLFLLFVYR